MKKTLEEYLRGNKSLDECSDIENWMLLNLGGNDADQLFEQLFDNTPQIDEPDIRDRQKKYLDDYISWQQARKRKSSIRNGLGIFFYSAAVIAATIICTYSFVSGRTDPQIWKSEYAAYGQVRNIVLPDSTQIWLHDDSKIVYPNAFKGGKRRIFASGEIFAKVRSDKKHPFVIDCEGATVTVLGTTFNLSAYEDNNAIQLTLLEGRINVDVPYMDDNLHFVLAPGDQMTVDKTTGESECRKIDPNKWRSWTDSRPLYFIDKSFKDIVMELQDIFGVTIVVKNSSLLSTRYLASFINNESLDMILASLNADEKMIIKKTDEKYFIYPNDGTLK